MIICVAGRRIGPAPSSARYLNPDMKTYRDIELPDWPDKSPYRGIER
jgi:hypothetical protein